MWLRRGGALIVFPAGEVAHARRSRRRARRLAMEAGDGPPGGCDRRQSIPAFIRGGNSRTFYAAGRVHPALRTLLLPRELLKKRGIDRGRPALAGRVQLEHAAGDASAATAAVRTVSGESFAVAGRTASSETCTTDPVAAEVAALPIERLPRRERAIPGLLRAGRTDSGGAAARSAGCERSPIARSAKGLGPRGRSRSLR